MTGLSALDLFQASGCNQDTILVTSYIDSAVSCEVNTNGQEQGEGIIKATLGSGHNKCWTTSRRGKGIQGSKLFIRTEWQLNI